MTEQDLRYLEAAKRMYRGESEENETIAADIVWHVPGHNPVSGDYHGYTEYTKLMPSRMAPLSRWAFELDDVMVNGNFVVATWHMQGERKGRKLESRGAHIMRLNEKAQVVEGWGFADDQDAVDAFFAN